MAVGGGQKATVVSSADGVNWTPWYWTPQDPLFDPYTFTGVAFGNGKFVAVSAGNGGPRSVATSPDGIAWAQAEGAGPHYAGTLTFGNGPFVAAGEYYSSANNILISHSVIYTSQDGVNWAQQADKAIESVLFSS